MYHVCLLTKNADKKRIKKRRDTGLLVCFVITYVLDYNALCQLVEQVYICCYLYVSKRNTALFVISHRLAVVFFSFGQSTLSYLIR
jgi:hypothetical protein